MSNRRRLRPGAYRHLRESAAAVLDAPSASALTPISESSASGLAATGTPHRYRARLIASDVWGSSGYYPREVIARDGPVAFPNGTACYIDHPRLSEEDDRPERSIRDIGAHIVSTPVLEADGLYADIEVVPMHATLIAGLWKRTGMSVRASGLAEMGEAGGRQGMIIKSITRGHSVDFVTKAGAGGAIVSLLEAARERGLVVALSETPASQVRSSIERAVKDTYGAPETYVWLRDYDPDRGVAWFEIGAGGTDTCWEQGYAASGSDVALLGPRRQVVAETVYRPVIAEYVESATCDCDHPEPATTDPDGTPPAETNTTEEAGMSGTETGAAPAQAGTSTAALTEADRDRLTAERETALREAAESKQAAATAQAELARYRAVEQAGPIVDQKLAESGLPAAAVARVRAGVLGRVPLTEAGVLDETALRSLAEADVTAERTYVASLQEAAGAGRVSGFGSTPVEPAAPNADQFEATLAESFQRIGMTPERARLAAAGRNS